MVTTTVFALFLVGIVVLRYCWPWRERCPQCQVPRQGEEPICSECSWIFQIPDDSEDIYCAGDAEQADFGELEETSR